MAGIKALELRKKKKKVTHLACICANSGICVEKSLHSFAAG